MSTITVYTTPGCEQCPRLLRILKNKGLDYNVIDITTDAAARTYIVDTLGYQSVPVVVANDNHWVGIRPDKLVELQLEFRE